MSITGARGASVKQVAISLLNVGIVLKSDLADPDAPVNTVSMSGKAMGGLVVAVDADGFSNPRIYMATSSASDAEWIDLADSGAGATVSWSDITGKPTTFAPPAATSTVTGGVKQAAAVANATSASSNVVAALASDADLATTVAKVNEVITALNTVRSNAGASLTTVNAALTSLRASGALAT